MRFHMRVNGAVYAPPTGVSASPPSSSATASVPPASAVVASNPKKSYTAECTSTTFVETPVAYSPGPYAVPSVPRTTSCPFTSAVAYRSPFVGFATYTVSSPALRTVCISPCQNAIMSPAGA